MEDSEEPLAARILQQVEYYFGDENLARDKFMRKTICARADRFVAIDVLCGFRRMTALSMDTPVVAAALEASEALELSEDRLMVRRREAFEMPPAAAGKLGKRTVYARALREGTTPEALAETFARFGPVESVQLLGDAGSEALVVFANKGGAGRCKAEAAGRLDALDGAAVVSRHNPGRALTDEERANFATLAQGGGRFERAGNARLAAAFAADRAKEKAAAGGAPAETPEEREARRAKLYAFENAETGGRPPKLRLAMKSGKVKVTTRVARGPVPGTSGFASGRVHPELAPPAAAED